MMSNWRDYCIYPKHPRCPDCPHGTVIQSDNYTDRKTDKWVCDLDPGEKRMHKLIDADVLIGYLDELRRNATEPHYTSQAVREATAQIKAYNNCKLIVERMPVADVELVRHGLIEQVKKYAADMEEMYTKVCADFRERTGKDYVCGACKYNDCAYVGADGDWCGECPGFESDECFVLSDELKRKIWEIVYVVNGTKREVANDKHPRH